MKNQGRGGYPEHISKVIYESEPTATFTKADWIALALAALDQAGTTPAQLADAYRHGRGRMDWTIEELLP